MSASVRNHPRKYLLIYDGNCRLCSIVKNKLSIKDSEENTQFMPYETKEAMQILGKKYKPGNPSMAYRIDENGVIYEGLDAFIPLFLRLRGGWILKTLWKISIFRWVSKKAYNVVAKYRYSWFGSVTSK